MTAARLRLVSPAQAAEWTETQIKELARSDVRTAMDMVIRKTRDRLYYHALGILKDGQESYDLVQEVYIRAMREPRFWDDEFRQKAWLYRVCSNLAFNKVRDRKRRGAILEAMPVAEGAPPRPARPRLRRRAARRAARGHRPHDGRPQGDPPPPLLRRPVLR